MRAVVLACWLSLTVGVGGSSGQPSWERRSEAKVHALMQAAAVSHQNGEINEAVQALKKAIKLEKSDSAVHAEAYSALSKCYSDQGQTEKADKAQATARRLNNERLADRSLF